MKPYRVKRAGRLIGSFLVVHDGKRVNLETKDASEARRRALLVAKGQWPPQSNEAASAVRAALEGNQDDEQQVAVEVESSAGDPVEAVRDGAVGAPASVGPAGAGDVAAPPEPVAAADAVNAAAAFDEEPADLDALAGEARSVLAEAGLDLAEIREKAPQIVSGAHLWIQGQLARAGIRVFKGRWPKMVTLPPTDEMRLLLGKIDVALLAKLNVDVEKISPVWWLVGLSAVTALAQVGGMLEEIETTEKAEEAERLAKVN